MCCDDAADEHDLGPTPPFCTAFQPGTTLLAVGVEEGVVTLLDTGKDSRSQSGERRTHFLAHTNAIFDLAWVPTRRRHLTASGDQTIRQFDLEAFTELRAFRGHRASVKAVAPMDANTFASGARDGNICLWDDRLPEPRPALIIADAHSSAASGGGKRKRSLSAAPHPGQSVSSVVALQDASPKLVSAGATDGTMKVWTCAPSAAASAPPPRRRQRRARRRLRADSRRRRRGARARHQRRSRRTRMARGCWRRRRTGRVRV